MVIKQSAVLLGSEGGNEQEIYPAVVLKKLSLLKSFT